MQKRNQTLLIVCFDPVVLNDEETRERFPLRQDPSKEAGNGSMLRQKLKSPTYRECGQIISHYWILPNNRNNAAKAAEISTSS